MPALRSGRYLAVGESMEETPRLDLLKLQDHISVSAAGSRSNNIFIEWERDEDYGCE